LGLLKAHQILITIFFIILALVKKVISIICIVALLLSTSSFAYFYWLQEHLHQTKVFSEIKAGTFKEDDICHTFITLELKEKSVLPKGYEWEEEGKEFIYKGMLFDIVAMEQTKEGWLIKAASDEEEALMVSNKRIVQIQAHSDNKSSDRGFKLNISQIVFDNNLIDYTFSLGQAKPPKHCFYLQAFKQVYLFTKSPPPQFI